MSILKQRLLALVLFAIALSSCDKQRDLFVKASTVLLINTDWKDASVKPDRWMAMFYNGTKYSIILDKTRDSTFIHNGNYAALCVNGTLTGGIDYVRFRGADNFDTFEAYATTKSLNLMFKNAGGSTINHPDTLYGTSVYKEVAGDDGFYLKYRNGRNGFLIPTTHLGDSILFIPQRLVYKVTVVATLHAFQNAAKNTYIVATQSGFASSVFIGSGMPSHQTAYQEFSFPRAAAGTTTYSQSSPYSSFGPPLDLTPGERRYSVQLKMVLSDGSLYDRSFDVSTQVEAIINQIKSTHIKEFIIYISDTLPDVIDAGIDVGIAPWEDDIRIPIPV